MTWFSFSLLRGQGPARAVYVSSPTPRLVSGETVRLAAIARDANGAASANAVFTWRSGNTAIATVDANGVVTARALGLVDIFATAAGIQGQTRLQVLPLRVDVYPPTAELFVGARLQYRAVAVDKDGNPLPNVTFQWQLTGANGGGTQAAAITANGVLSARAAARVTVRAVVPYGGVLSQFVPSFVGLARLEIAPRNDFRLSRLLSTTDVRHSFQLRSLPGRPLVANDAGQVAFIGSLDGLTTALLLYDNGRFQLLAAGGAPGPTSGSVVQDFSGLAINNRGQVLARITARATNGVLLASREGSTYLAVDGEAAAGVEGLGGFNLTPYSLNDNGDAVLFGSFRVQNSTQNRNGLFRLAAGGVPQRLVTSGDEFPGLGAANVSSNEFGIDRDGVVYFIAASGPTRALYRQERFLAPTRLIGAGDPLADSTVRTLSTPVVGANGDVAFFYTLNNNAQGVARLSGGRVEYRPLRSTGGLLAGHSQGGLVYWADGERGWGLYRWNGSGPSTALLLSGRLAPNDEPLQQVYSAAVNSRGEVFAQLRTSQTDLLVARLGAAQPLLFQSGARLNLTAGLQLQNGSLVRGNGSGAPYILLGSPSSIFQFDSRGLVPRLVNGDRLPDGATFYGVGSRFENAAGDLYFDSLGNSNRVLTADRLENLVLGNFRDDDGVLVNRGLVLALNDRGAMVWQAGTNRSHTRVYLAESNRSTLLFFYGAETRWQTPSPAGGTINNRNDVVLDDNGRVLAVLRVVGGPAGVFLWENGRWRATALFNTTEIRGQIITNATNLIALADRFYAVLSLRAGGSALAELRDGEWTWIAGNQDQAPHGNVINNIGAYDVNRRGDLAMTINGGQLLVFRSGGEDRLVHFNVEAPDGADFFSVDAVELREDGKIYFSGVNILDQYVLYLAEPLLTHWPSRSRQKK